MKGSVHPQQRDNQTLTTIVVEVHTSRNQASSLVLRDCNILVHGF